MEQDLVTVTETTQVTVSEIDELLKSLYEKDLEVEAKKDELKELNKQYTQIEFRIAAFLEELGRKDYSSEYGKFTFKKVLRINMPENLTEKMKFFDYLKSKSLFEEYATVHANSLKKYYNLERLEAERRGEDMMTWSLPGLGMPKIDIEPDFKPNKKKGAQA